MDYEEEEEEAGTQPDDDDEDMLYCADEGNDMWDKNLRAQEEEAVAAAKEPHDEDVARKHLVIETLTSSGVAIQ